MQIEWDEKLCIHSGNCVTSLPTVFQIESGSFIIDPTKGIKEKIVGVINECPSKALKIIE